MIFILMIVFVVAVTFGLKDYRKTDIEQFEFKSDVYRYFYPVSLYIYDKAVKKNKKELSVSTREKLRTLQRYNYDEYIARRISKLILIFLGVCFMAGVAYISYENDKFINDNKIKRPDAGKKPYVYEINVNDGEREYLVTATVSPVVLKEDERIHYFEAAYDEALLVMCGENTSLECVSTNLVLKNKYQNGLISAEWESSDYRIIEDDGTVHSENAPAEGVDVILTCILSYGDYEEIHDIYVTVVRKVPSKEEAFLEEIDEALGEADKGDIYDKDYVLPDNIGGHKVSYQVTGKNYSYIIFIVGIIVCGILIFVPDSDISKSLNDRKRQMILDYSEIVSKLVLLLGAGMTLRRAFERIIVDYKRAGKKRFAYDEIEKTLIKMEAGFGEADCYEDLAIRCRVPEYTKLVAILTQNLRKGNEGLLEKLSLEMSLAFEQRKNIARKSGEEASTKLLIPMIVQLIIVIMIVMIPIFMTF